MGTVASYPCRARDLTGERFGRLSVVGFYGFSGKKNNQQKWLCQCDCGGTKAIRRDALLSGATNSCGCLHDEASRDRFTKHGQHGTTIYKIWGSMISRCHGPSPLEHYGARGIKVCDEWRDFSGFYEWAKKTYVIGLSIDRIDVDGNYEPKNCRWADSFVQAINKQKNKKEGNGVYWDKQTKKWRSEIAVRGVKKSLGRHLLREDAIKARKKAEGIYFAPLLSVNKTDEQLGIVA